LSSEELLDDINTDSTYLSIAIA